MTRTRNASFVGTNVYDADVDAAAFTRVLREIVQDFNRLYDVATGENGIAAADTMNHDGTAQHGSLLGIPIVNQIMNVRLSMADSAVGTYGGDHYYLAAPVKVAPGEGILAVEVDSIDGPALTLEVYDGTGALSQSILMSKDEALGMHYAFPQFTTVGRYYFLVRGEADTPSGSYIDWTLIGWRVYVPRLRAVPPSTDPQEASLIPVASASGVVAIPVETFHDEFFVDNYGVPGWLVTNLSRSINAFYEAARGAAVPGNSAITNADSATVNPVTSRFLFHGRAGLTAEPLVDFPLLAEALGAIRTDAEPTIDATPATTGLLSWHAPFPVDVAASRGRSVSCYVPDFPNGVSSALRMTVLAVNSPLKGAWSGNWQVRGVTGAASSAWATLTQLGTTNFYVATTNPVDFTPDARQTLSLETQKTAGVFVFGEMAVLGWSWDFDP